ncbi:MAG: hypothetical protein IT435_13680 [Phycisphaerales bacterium]|nr:hypothetical protein [Phycisphaerales bacterium]
MHDRRDRVVCHVRRGRGHYLPYDYAGGFHGDRAYANGKPGNYRVGHSPVTTMPDRRNFFTFDLTEYDPIPPGMITSATLKLYVPKSAPDMGYLDPGDGYISPDPFEIYRVTSTTFSADEITDPTLTTAEALAIYATLGTGPVAGEVASSPADKARCSRSR